MTTPNFSEYTDMTEEKFKECLGRVDMKAFMKNPTQALLDAGITLKKGFTFKFVETEEAANSLPANVVPLIHTKNNEQLGMEDLDKIAGGNFLSNQFAIWTSTGFQMGEIMAANRKK